MVLDMGLFMCFTGYMCCFFNSHGSLSKSYILDNALFGAFFAFVNQICSCSTVSLNSNVYILLLIDTLAHFF